MEKREEVLEYVADMASQLSILCRGHIPFISELLAFIAVIVQREVDK